MKKIKLFILGLISILSLSLAGCSGSKEEASYRLNFNTASLMVGETITLEVTKNDVILTDGISWSSDNESIAAVKNGEVKALAKGECKIIAKVSDKALECLVKVSLRPSYAISASEVLLEVNKEATIKLLNNGEEVSDGISWSSKDMSVATVENGIIKGISAGECKVVAIYEGKSYFTSVIVVDALSPVEGLYHAAITVPEMDNRVFEFDITLNSDNTYRYYRYKSVLQNDVIAEEVVSTGTYEYNNARLTLKDDKNVIKFIVDNKDQFKSDGKIITGGVEAELTFKRVVEK